jgi:hypothetical protein
MPAVTNVLLNTPWWVFGLFATLTWLGVQALQARTLPIWRLLATPLLFITWGIVSLAAQSLSSPILLVDWLSVAMAAGTASATSRHAEIRIDRARQRVSLSGSAVPLIRNLLIFSIEYGLAIAIAIVPAFRFELSLADIAVSGAIAGYFLGWLMRFVMIYQRAADPLAAPAQQ